MGTFLYAIDKVFYKYQISIDIVNTSNILDEMNILIM